MVNPQKRLARADAEIDTLLTAAVKNNQLEQVEYLLTQGCDINGYNANAMTPLMLACEQGHSDIVRLLFEHGADIELADIMGQTALYYALDCNNKNEVIELLLEFGANVNSVDDNGVSPLMASIIMTDSVTAINLIKLGADINAIDNDGLSVLEYAVEYKKTELLEYLTNVKI